MKCLIKIVVIVVIGIMLTTLLPLKIRKNKIKMQPSAVLLAELK